MRTVPLQAHDDGTPTRRLAKGLLEPIYHYIAGFQAVHGRDIETGGMLTGQFAHRDTGPVFTINGFIGAGPNADCSEESVLFDTEYRRSRWRLCGSGSPGSVTWAAFTSTRTAWTRQRGRPGWRMSKPCEPPIRGRSSLRSLRSTTPARGPSACSTATSSSTSSCWARTWDTSTGTCAGARGCPNVARTDRGWCFGASVLRCLGVSVLGCFRSRSTGMHRNTETPKHRNTETPKHRNTDTPEHRNSRLVH